ncbi:hypothetical protein ABVK25_005494 [Lepraria finkii]|uniref:Uncharacterized protein n=1 Tax=Lepraria finkii TaxID=1340010 RepID=A0ABR4BEP3_9LECA
MSSSPIVATVPAGPSPNIPLSPSPIPIDKDVPKTERLKDIFDRMTTLIPSLDFSPEERRLLKVYAVEKVIELKEKKDAGSEKGLTKEWKNTLKDLEGMRGGKGKRRQRGTEWGRIGL